MSPKNNNININKENNNNNKFHLESVLVISDRKPTRNGGTDGSKSKRKRVCLSTEERGDG